MEWRTSTPTTTAPQHRHAELVEQIDRARFDYFVQRLADPVRRRLRPADARAAGDRGGQPRPADAGLADPDGRRHLLHRVHRGRPPRADDEPGQRLLRRGAGGLGRPGGAGPRHRRRALPVRDQGRRRRDQPPLREGPADPGADPRQRHHRRGRHPQHPHPRQRPRAAHRQGRAGPARGARRGVLPGRGLRRSQRRAGRGRQGAVRQPAQRRRRVVAAEGPAGHREPAADDGRARRRRPRGLHRGPAVRGLRRAARARPAGQRPVPGRRRPGRRAGLHRLLRRAPARRRARDRRRGGQGRRGVGAAPARARPHGHPAGRSRSSTRPRRSRRRCSTSGSTSGAPAG